MLFGYHIPTINTGYLWLDLLLYFYLAMFALMIYRRWSKGELALAAKLLTSPLLLTLFIADVGVNYLVLWILGPRPYATWTISQRFEFYRDQAYHSGFNKTLANVTCWTINLFDAFHC